jgi:nucleotide-binding universal stress UspA family protein
MPNYNRVLIPIDLTPRMGRLTPAVQRLIDTSEAEITLLHVVEPQPWLSRNGHAARLMSELELFAQRQFRGARIARRIEWGRPADCILSVIRAGRMDAMLMSAGTSPEGGSALGPVAAEVLAEAPCPVLLEWDVTPPVNRARTHPVCCAIEFDGSEEAVLREAAWAAAKMEAPLKVMGSLLPSSPRSAMLWNRDERELEVAIAESRIQSLCDRWAPEAKVKVGLGPPAAVYSRAIRLHGAGLMVAGGSRENLLAAESACPVLYVGPARRSKAERSMEFAVARGA